MSFPRIKSALLIGSHVEGAGYSRSALIRSNGARRRQWAQRAQKAQRAQRAQRVQKVKSRGRLASGSRALILVTCLEVLLKAHSPSTKCARKPLNSAAECFLQLPSFQLNMACTLENEIDEHKQRSITNHSHSNSSVSTTLVSGSDPTPVSAITRMVSS